jgi:hypothetical protein
MKFQLILSVIVLDPSLAWATSNNKVCTPSIVDLFRKGCAHTRHTANKVRRTLAVTLFLSLISPLWKLMLLLLYVVWNPAGGK